MTIESTLRNVYGWTPAEERPGVEVRILDTNCALEEAGRIQWEDLVSGRHLARRCLQQFAETAGMLEDQGWPADRIKSRLRPSREVFATSAFMRRCQERPRGYPGDFETIEYLVAGVNRSVPGTLGWHIEEILLQAPIVQRHRNKLKWQSREIAGAVAKNRAARVLSIGCAGCLDWVPLLPELDCFAGEIVLNDSEPAALELAEQRLSSATSHYRLAPGNPIRVVKCLGSGAAFDLVLAGGVFDYVPHRATVMLLRVIYRDLLAEGGTLLFTNIAEGNPWRRLMEYGSDWPLIERSGASILEMCAEAGIPRSQVTVSREETGLTLVTRVTR